ncbi:unnamed protein product [Allacma fusca]|uniref:Uncharacterized protein n=1 Tax=Allacma fusca TaxID=39272 RepID=A0A8J2PDV1_9HEXA|nr:unnamed protein product [Allacma fusca]
MSRLAVAIVICVMIQVLTALPQVPKYVVGPDGNVSGGLDTSQVIRQNQGGLDLSNRFSASVQFSKRRGEPVAINTARNNNLNIAFRKDYLGQSHPRQ